MPPMTDVAIRALISRGVADALAEHEIQRNNNYNGDGSQGSGSGITRPVRPTYEMEFFFHISNCAIKNQVKFATCTLHGIALTWWNVKTIAHDAAYGNIMSTKPKTMEEVIEMENNLMDQKPRTLAERQIENKRKQDDDSRNNQNQQ
ncbi:hypothetical protein Tco_1567415 [Tanacetum coccineum]